MEISWRVIRGQIDPRRRSYLYQQTWIWAYCLNYGCMMEWTWTKHKFINGTLWMADEFKHWNSKRRFYMFDNNIFPRTSFYRQWQVQEEVDCWSLTDTYISGVPILSSFMDDILYCHLIYAFGSKTSKAYLDYIMYTRSCTSTLVWWILSLTMNIMSLSDCCHD